jgi:hypothetical protein
MQREKRGWEQVVIATFLLVGEIVLVLALCLGGGYFFAIVGAMVAQRVTVEFIVGTIGAVVTFLVYLFVRQLVNYELGTGARSIDARRTPVENGRARRPFLKKTR